MHVADKYFGSHEITGREEVVKTSSDRSFGFFFAGFCLIATTLSIYRGGSHWPWWLAGAVAFALVAVVQPQLLGPLNRLWIKLGRLLSRVTSPIILALLFYGCITPMGWILRAAGKDLLSLRLDPEMKSYWIPRSPPGPSADTLKNQF
jgi:hypothetical protein